MMDDTADKLALLAKLTPRQRDVFELVIEGRLNKQIAFELDMAESTVKAHLSVIFRKLGTKDRRSTARNYPFPGRISDVSDSCPVPLAGCHPPKAAAP